MVASCPQVILNMAFPSVAIAIGALQMVCVLVSELSPTQGGQTLVSRPCLSRSGIKSVVFFLSLSIRRLYFHKLSKYPGPWFNAVSPIPLCMALISGRQHAYLRKLHDNYGQSAGQHTLECIQIWLSTISSQALSSVQLLTTSLLPLGWHEKIYTA